MDKYSTDWKLSEAYENVKELLQQKGSSLKGTIAANDGTASGAIAVLKEAEIECKVFVIDRMRIWLLLSVLRQAHSL